MHNSNHILDQVVQNRRMETPVWSHMQEGDLWIHLKTILMGFVVRGKKKEEQAVEKTLFLEIVCICTAHEYILMYCVCYVFVMTKVDSFLAITNSVISFRQKMIRSNFKR